MVWLTEILQPPMALPMSPWLMPPMDAAEVAVARPVPVGVAMSMVMDMESWFIVPWSMVACSGSLRGCLLKMISAKGFRRIVRCTDRQVFELNTTAYVFPAPWYQVDHEQGQLAPDQVYLLICGRSK